MSAEKPAPGPLEPNVVAFDRARRPTRIGADLLQRATLGRPDFRLAGAGRRARDLIGLLMSHGARIRRAARPRCRIALQVLTPAGEPAVEVTIE